MKNKDTLYKVWRCVKCTKYNTWKLKNCDLCLSPKQTNIHKKIGFNPNINETIENNVNYNSDDNHDISDDDTSSQFSDQ